MIAPHHLTAASVIRRKLGDLKEMLLNPVIDMVRNTIITKAVTKIVSMLNPAGAIYQACMMIYNVVSFFLNNWDRLKEIVGKIFDSLALSATGAIGYQVSVRET